MSQSKRIAINTISSWAGIFVNGAILIFLTKFLLTRLDKDSFGIFQYVRTIQASLLFLDLGLGATLNRYVSQLLVSEKNSALNAAVSFATFLFGALGIIAGVVMVVIGSFIPVFVTGCSTELYAAAFVLMSFMAANLMIRFWGYAPRGVLFGLQRYDIVNIILIAAAILRAAGITILLLKTSLSTFFVIGICFLVSRIIETLCLWFFAKLQCKKLTVRLNQVDKNIAIEMLKFSAYVLIVGITTMLIMNSPIFIIGRLYGAGSVAFISLPLLVIGQIQQVSGGFAFALIPVAGKYGALKDRDAIRQVLIKGTKFCAIMCFPIGILAVIFSQPLFEWFKEGFGWTWGLLAIISFPLLIRTTQRVSFSVMMGSGSVKWLAIAQVFAVALIWATSWLFGVFFDMKLYGIALSMATVLLLLGLVFQPLYACHQVGTGYLSYLKQSYGRVFIGTVPTAALGIIFIRYVYPNELIMIVSEGLICMSVFAVTAWFFILEKSEKQSIICLFRRSALAADK